MHAASPAVGIKAEKYSEFSPTDGCRPYCYQTVERQEFRLASGRVRTSTSYSLKSNDRESIIETRHTNGDINRCIR